MRNAFEHLVLVRPAADVEEVGRLAAVVLDQVHRAHRQAGAVDQAADVAVEADVAQARSCRPGARWGLPPPRRAGSASSGWRNRALSSKLILQSSASTSPASVTISGLISASEASVSRKRRTKALRKTTPFFAVSPFRPRAWQTLRAWKSARPMPTSIGSRWIFSGVSCADLLDLDAPLGRRHQHRALEVAVDGEAQVELAGDVVADGHQDLGDGLPFRPRLVGHERLAEHARGRGDGLFGRADELHPLGHPLGARLAAAGDLERLLAVDLGADGHPLAPPPRVDLRLDHDQAAAQALVGRRRLLRAS